MQMIVTTPEKWDVVTRKATGDVQLAQIVRLLIIDEVHLLHEDRGAVIESLVARTLRQVESSQTMIRIVGLSATLPNYLDVANFLRVNPHHGLFFFDGRFRPVPLTQTFIGIKTTNRLQQMKDMEEVCYDKVLRNIQRGHQVSVFHFCDPVCLLPSLFLPFLSPLLPFPLPLFMFLSSSVPCPSSLPLSPPPPLALPFSLTVQIKNRERSLTSEVVIS